MPHGTENFNLGGIVFGGTGNCSLRDRETRKLCVALSAYGAVLENGFFHYISSDNQSHSFFFFVNTIPKDRDFTAVKVPR